MASIFNAVNLFGNVPKKSQRPLLNNVDIMKNCVKTSSTAFKKRGYEWVKVGWDDCSRAFGSSIGSNISDWTFMLKDGTVLDFLRGPNYQDKTLTIKAKNLAIIVGNETVGGNLKAVTFQHYLENYGKYTPGAPDSLNLSAGSDELITIRYIAVIVPENKQGFQEVVPTAYSYQTYNKDDPKNFLGASFHLGVGSRMDGPKCEKVFLVKTNPDSTKVDSWFRITNEHKENEEQKKAVATVLGTRSTGVGRNRVQCFQIPRKQVKKVITRGGGPSYTKVYKCAAASTDSSEHEVCYRSLSIGNVSFGSKAGNYSAAFPDKMERDKTQSVTFTFAEYYTTPDGNLTAEQINTIADKLDKNYHDIKGEWLGSLVTGKQDISLVSKTATPPIKLPELTDKDKAEFDHKVTHFPKNLSDVQGFPDDTNKMVESIQRDLAQNNAQNTNKAQSSNELLLA